MINWDVYEISSEKYGLRGVRMRGRLRKFTLVNSMDLLAENAEDNSKNVRFAVLAGTDVSSVRELLLKIVPDIEIKRVLEDVRNPVLSKLKVNIEGRYTLPA